MIKSKKNEYKDFLNVEENEISKLPNGLNVSTMCASCKLGTTVNILNIEKYMSINLDDILCVKKTKDNQRTLIPIKIKNVRASTKDKNVKEVKSFYNCITVVIRVNTGIIKDWDTEPKINLKIFRNGSIQMSGCKSLMNINIVLNKLLIKLRNVKAITKDGEMVEKPFIDDLANLKIIDFKIDMINSNYKVNMNINREKLYKLLIQKKIKSRFEPCNRACVIIKHTSEILNIDNKEISIFIFQKGNIIITGARARNQIISAYNFINKILITHHDEIAQINELQEEDLINRIYNDIIEQTKSLTI
jgi:TATA-box binding protein (TBP) (component of TFIID and TFIIIB)